MRPTLAAESLKANLTQYLTTTFGLTDGAMRSGLAAFLTHPEQGIFRGAYIRIRTPFRLATDDWRQHLEWAPGGDWTPYGHQAKAFARLSTLRSAAQPTLVTTGTGSGKTESFLIPILDHCRRARRSGKAGVKAVLLYPMNALATDQTERIDKLLREEPDLADVTAGLYIGDVPAFDYKRVLNKRPEIRRNPPDILITNYKMLDLLLQRPDDLPLWANADLAYVVLDEFHSYDGAQGTDVAMLLRRLAAVAAGGTAEQPLGAICPVATSATLGSSKHSADAADAIRAVAAQVFGTTFDDESVVGEDRYRPDEFIGEVDYGLPIPHPKDLAAIPDPALQPEALVRIARAVLGSDDIDPVVLGRGLRHHKLTQAVLAVLDGRPRTPVEILDYLPRRGAGPDWGRPSRRSPRCGGRPGPVHRAAVGGPQPRQAPHAAAQHRNTPVGTPGVTASPRGQCHTGLRLVRRAATRPGCRTGRGRPGGGRRAADPVARQPLPPLRTVGLDGVLPGEGPAGPQRRPGPDLPGRYHQGEAAAACLHRGHPHRGGPAASGTARPGRRPARAAVRPGQRRRSRAAQRRRVRALRPAGQRRRRRRPVPGLRDRPGHPLHRCRSRLAGVRGGDEPVHRRRAGRAGTQDAAVQRFRAGRRLPGRVRGQPRLHLLAAGTARRPAHAGRVDRAQRGDRPGDHRRGRRGRARHRGAAGPARPARRGRAARRRARRHPGGVAAHRAAARVRDHHGVRSTRPVRPYPRTHPHRRGGGPARRPGRGRHPLPRRADQLTDPRAARDAEPGTVHRPRARPVGAAASAGRGPPRLVRQVSALGRAAVGDLGRPSGRHAGIRARPVRTAVRRDRLDAEQLGVPGYWP
ncbi:DEAD/DEAH box helicase [Luedemannella flava]